MGGWSDDVGTKGSAAPLIRGPGVSLGCGSLILIALIVLLVSNQGTVKVTERLERLEAEVGRVKAAIEAQTAELKQWRERMPGAAVAAEGHVAENKVGSAKAGATSEEPER